jgi:hypothetical protein
MPKCTQRRQLIYVSVKLPSLVFPFSFTPPTIPVMTTNGSRNPGKEPTAKYVSFISYSVSLMN